MVLLKRTEHFPSQTHFKLRMSSRCYCRIWRQILRVIRLSLVPFSKKHRC